MSITSSTKNPVELRCLLCGKLLPDDSDSPGICPIDGCEVSPEGTLFAQRFLLKQKLGSGGFGTVFKCQHIHLKKMLAIKILHEHAAKSRDTLLRFKREAKILVKLNHENIISIVDHEWHPRPFLSMEYLEGNSLEQRLSRDGCLSPQEAIPIFKQVCKALMVAHAAGIIHRDLKPGNIFLVGTGDSLLVKVLDFGIAKIEDTTLTSTGETMGSPTYMSPEQCIGGQLDERTDVYALGCVMYETLVGYPVFTGDTPFDIIRKHLLTIPVSLRDARPEANFSADLQQIIFKCLAKDREARYETMAELLTALEEAKMTGSNARRSTARFPLVWPGAVSGLLYTPLMATFSSLNETQLRHAELVIAAGFTMALLYWLHCVVCMKRASSLIGFKLQVGVLPSVLLTVLAPVMAVAAPWIVDSTGASPGLLLLPVLTAVGIALALVPLLDFYTFLKERTGRAEVTGALLCVMIAPALIVAPLVLLSVAVQYRFALLQVQTFAVACLCGAFLLLGSLAREMRNTSEVDPPVLRSTHTADTARRRHIVLQTSCAFALLTGAICSQLPGGILEPISPAPAVQGKQYLTQKDADLLYESSQNVQDGEERSARMLHQESSADSILAWNALALKQYRKANEAFTRQLETNEQDDYTELGQFACIVLQDPHDTVAIARAREQLLKAATKREGWVGKVMLFLGGKLPRDRLFSEVPAEPAGMATEAHFYSGVRYLIDGQKDQAIAEFQWVSLFGRKGYTEHGVGTLWFINLQGNHK